MCILSKELRITDLSHSYHKRISRLLPFDWLPEAPNDVRQVNSPCKYSSLPVDVTPFYVGALVCGECDAIRTEALPAVPRD